MSKIKLKPCPFCGDSNIHLEVCNDNVSPYSMCCYTCNTSGPQCDTKEDAEEAWNMRVKA
jgi:Lar family restriction alleviation protein